MTEYHNGSEVKCKKIKFYGAGKADVILNRSLNTIGPDKKFVTWMACTHAGLHYPPKKEDFKKIDVYQWYKITGFLGISLDSISTGYSQFLHIRGLFDKILSGCYLFPKNKRYFVIKRALKKFQKENRDFEKKYCTKRLYFKIRWMQLKSNIACFPRFMLNSINSRITYFLSKITYNRLIAYRGCEGYFGNRLAAGCINGKVQFDIDN